MTRAHYKLRIISRFGEMRAYCQLVKIHLFQGYEFFEEKYLEQ